MLLALSALAALRYWPHEPLRDRIPVSVTVVDAEGRLLRVALAADGQYRIWTPLDAVSPLLVRALLLHEDRHFRHHPGVNPVALVRAARVTWSGGPRQGASTITMQLARLLYGLDTRSAGGKLQQIFHALWLEARYSKDELLEAHLNLLPFGGNVQGVGAASRVYFDKDAMALTLNEALTLVLVPQSPTARNPRRAGGEPASLHDARARLLARWRRAHPGDAAAALAGHPPPYRRESGLPFHAPHLSTRLLAEAGAGEARVRATLDLRLQGLIERRLRQYLEEHAGAGLRNAAVLLLDHRDMAVRAVVGSADFGNAAIAGQVDGTEAKRSPGSTIKPFIYALALDQGLIHPRTMLKDTPTHFGAFSPENFDGAFVGPITAHDALIRSRNVPAVALAARLTRPGLHQFLRQAGISRLASERHYGLALALGGGELTMAEVAGLYAMLAQGGRLRPPRYRQDDPVTPGAPLLSPEAAFLVLDMLRDNPRPDVPESERAARAPVAWKTGTSWGFRDAWTAGVFGPWVLVVWIGNFDGQGNPAFVGLTAAAPLFLQLVDAITATGGMASSTAFLPPPGLKRVEVCAASGELPNADCPQTLSTWFIPGRSPIRVSTLHRRLRIDVRNRRQACADTPARFVREELHEFWPSELARLFAQAGLPRRPPPPAGDCAGPQGGSVSGLPPQIVSPLRAVSYPVPTARLGSTVIPLNAHADAGVTTLYWFIDGAYVGAGRPGVALAWTPTRAGEFAVSVVDDRGREDARPLRLVLP